VVFPYLDRSRYLPLSAYPPISFLGGMGFSSLFLYILNAPEGPFSYICLKPHWGTAYHTVKIAQGMVAILCQMAP
jgi:hypothetical protein